MLFALNMGTPRENGLMIGAALAGLAGAAIWSGCAGESVGSCDGDDSCDAQGTFAQRLESKADPIAVFLKAQKLSSDGKGVLDFGTVLFGIAKQQGCGDASVSTFIVSDDLVSGGGSDTGEPFPRLVSVACSNDNAKASDFFIATVGEAQGGEIDVTDVEMFAWDATARQYNFYAFRPSGAKPGEVGVEIDPARCRQCHLTPSDTAADGMRMTPIFNELNQPWTHWNAEPGFPSHGYDLPERVKKAKTFVELAEGHKGAASRFEEIIRFGGHEKVVAARIRDRREPGTVSSALDMLRPLFCSEQINYATEDFASGVVPSAALVDPGIRNMYRAIRPDNWAWGFVNDERTGVGIVRLPAPAGAEQPVEQIPVRGNADVMFEQRLVATGVLTPFQVLRVRALDWQTPVFSDFRCGLWKSGKERLTKTPPKVPDGAKLSDLLPVVFEEIMSLDGKPLKPSGAEELIAMPLATPGDVSALRTAVGSGKIADGTCSAGGGFCVSDSLKLGNAIDGYVNSILDAGNARQQVTALRDARICRVLQKVTPVDKRFVQSDGTPARFMNRPSLPIPSSCP